MQSGKPSSRNNTDRRSAYYPRWSFQYSIRHNRSCKYGSHPSRDSSSAEQKKQETDQSTSEETSPKEIDQKSSSTPAVVTFFHLLRNRTPNLYRLLQQEFEKDRHEWVFDPKEVGSVWNTVESGNISKHVYGPEEPSPISTIKEDPLSKQQPTVTKAEAEAEEFMIDPITCRKVPVIKISKAHMKEDSLYPRHQSIPTGIPESIPIEMKAATTGEEPKSSKQSVSAKLKPSLGSGRSSRKHNWLVKEGFAMNNNDSSMLYDNSAKIQPSLDRVVINNKAQRGSLQYPPRDVTTDDVDLLRASDVRAASGHFKAKSRLSDGETKARSQALEKNWDQTEEAWSRGAADTYHEVMDKQRLHSDQRKSGIVSTGLSKSSNLEEFRKAKQRHDELQDEIRETDALLKRARNDVLRDSLAEEAKLIRNSFDAFEGRTRKHMTVASDIQDGLDTREENPAVEEGGLKSPGQDIKLVDEIRAIYEEDYGMITAEHKQGSLMTKKVDRSLSKGAEESDLRTTHSTVSTAKLEEPQLYPPTSDASTLTLDHTKVICVRDLLYQSIETMNIDTKLQKRIKFALRGVPELDIEIPKSSSIEGGVKESPISPEHRFIPEPSSTDMSPRTSTSSKLDTSSTDQPKSVVNESKSSNYTKHVNRHHGLDNSQTKKHEETTFIYKILALDTASKEVAVATTTSSIKHKSSVPRSAAGVLVHLDQPAKYFSHMESLDAKGFQLVSGSRTMLVYRRRISTDGISAELATKEIKSSGRSRALNPLREEPVFSGHLHPKARLLRSRQLAHRRAESASANKSSEPASTSTNSSSSQESMSSTDQATKPKTLRNLTGTLITVTLVVTLCYTIGLLQDMRFKNERDKSMRMIKAEAIARRLEAQKNDWRWF